MYKKKNAAKNLIERASCHLRGEKAPVRVSTEEDEIQAYLSALNRKTGEAAASTTSKKPKSSFNFEELSDLSLSEGDLTPKKKTPPSASKYLKAKKPTPEPEKTTEKFIKKPAPTKDSQKENHAPVANKPKVRDTQNKSLSKIAAFEEKFRNRKANAAKFQMSDSDLDSITFSTSIENEIANEVPGLKAVKISKSRPSPKKSPDKNNNEGFMKKEPTATTGQPIVSKTMHKFGTKNNLNKYSDDESTSLGIGKGSSKFLKKKPTPVPEAKPAVMTADVRASPTTMKKLRFDLSEDSEMMEAHRRSGEPPSPSTQPLKPALKTSSSFRQSRESDSDLADYMEGISLSTSTSTPRRGAGMIRQTHFEDEEDELPRPSSKPFFQTSSSFGETVILTDPFEALDDEEPSIQESITTDDSYKNDISEESIPEEVNVIMDIGSLEPIGDVNKEKNKKRPKSPEPMKKHVKKTEKTKKVADKSKKFETSTPKPAENDFFASMGLMSVDDLLGAKEISEEEPEPIQVFGQKSEKKISKKLDKKKPKKNESSDLFSSFGLQTVEDLLGGYSEASIQEESEVPEVPETARSELTEIRTISEIKSVPSYDDDFESIHSDYSSRKDSIPYSEDFEETSVSEILTEGRDDYKDRQYSYDTISDSGTLTPSDDETRSYSESYTSYTDSRTYTDSRSVMVVRKKEMKAVEVQTGGEGGLGNQWNYQGVGMAYVEPTIGLGYTDPTPIATHAVSPDAIEAMTAYSPSVIALNDMLRMQIQLTQQFSTMQQQFYNSLNNNIESSYQYTTLEDTKEYIRKHKKPMLTFDEALKMVKEEMGER